MHPILLTSIVFISVLLMGARPFAAPEIKPIALDAPSLHQKDLSVDLSGTVIGNITDADLTTIDIPSSGVSAEMFMDDPTCETTMWPGEAKVTICWVPDE